MKRLQYMLLYMIPLLALCIPMGLLAYASFTYHYEFMMYAAIAAVIGVGATMATKGARVRIRQEVETDEFGNSKKKGKYENLTRAEREAIDLQKTADAERILNSSAIKKMTKEGSKDPEGDMDALIGLTAAKEKMSEMAARMKFDSESEGKKKKKKKKGEMPAESTMSGRHMVFTGAPGTGKAQPLYSKILTPSGFVSMGSIRVGDTVISGTGKRTEVAGVFPQGVKPVYELTFDDGSTCRCSDEHLWTLQTEDDRRNGQYRTITLNKLMEGQNNGEDYSVDYVKAVEFPDRVLPVHPYLAGLYLAGGCTSFQLPGNEIKAAAAGYLPDGCAFENSGSGSASVTGEKSEEFLFALSSGVHMKDGGIPPVYMYASKEQRTQLLTGLLDIAGTVRSFDEDMHYHCPEGILFKPAGSDTKALVEDTAELVHSLGGFARVMEGNAKAPELLICFEGNTNSLYFTSERKKQQCSRISAPPVFKRHITDVRYIGKEDCQCIYVDDPSHLYVTDNYVITHNTTCARIMAGFLYEYGFISQNKCIEVDGNFLKAGIDTATKTELVIRQAYDGVLFIDEAYALMDGGTSEGDAAVATLIKQMEDARGRFILILAGYSNEMNALLKSNPGFASRVKEYIDFPSYERDEMREIFTSMAKSAKFTVSDDAWGAYDSRIEKERGYKTFANARTARNVLDESIDRHALNYSRGVWGKEDRYVLHAQDIPLEPKRVLGA